MLQPANLFRTKEQQIYGLLKIDSLEQIAFRKEIPPIQLMTALKELYHDRSEFDKIIFEDRGTIELLDNRKSMRLYFEVAAVSHYRKNWFANVLEIHWVDYLGAISVYEPNQGIIVVRNPS